MDSDCSDPLTPTHDDALPGPGMRTTKALLRAEALRQLHWQQRAWRRVLAAHAPGTPCLIGATERAGIHDALDLLRAAGEDVPARLYHRGSLVRTTDAASGVPAEVRLAGLLVDLDRVLAWLDPE
ncbi:MAG: hypothetical protein K0S78_4406 [Thermomicrobiales bacterium]|nr:hypothetical protein [Thermomicrobiales bacterium]